jgi:GGDEF domain-containing protein
VRRLKRSLPHDIDCAIGVAIWNAGESATGLFRRADQTLYANKARDRIRDLAA